MNVFLDLAEKQISNPRKRRLQVAEQRARDKALRERAVMSTRWKAWHREQTKSLLTGPHGEAARELAAFLEEMTLEQGPELVALVARGPWRETDSDTRYQVLRVVDHAIAHVRERAGLPPFSDSLPFSDEPPTAFEIIRAELLA